MADKLGFARADLAPAIYPMVGASGGRIIAISSPNGPSGPLYDLSRQEGVETITVPAAKVSHFDLNVIAELRGRLGPALARQELDAEFVASSASVFSADTLDAMFASVEPFGTGEEEATQEASAQDSELTAAERLKRRLGLCENAATFTGASCRLSLVPPTGPAWGWLETSGGIGGTMTGA